MYEEFKIKKTYLENEIYFEFELLYWLFLSLDSDDSDVTEVVLVFEQLLYDVYEVFGWFVWGKLAMFLRFKDLDFKAQRWRFYEQF